MNTYIKYISHLEYLIVKSFEFIFPLLADVQPLKETKISHIKFGMFEKIITVGRVEVVEPVEPFEINASLSVFKNVQDMIYDDSKFKLLKAYRHHWLKNISSGGAQDVIIKNKPLENVIIKSWSNRYKQIWTHTTPEHLAQLLTNDKNIYEVLASYPQKVYFDIDRKNYNDNEQYFLNDTLDQIKKYFKGCKFSISGGIGKDKRGHIKTSYHIILNNILMHNEEDKIKLKGIVQELYKKNEFFDTRVYNKNQNFKCPIQSKHDDPRPQLIIKNNDIRSHIITSFFKFNSLSMPIFNSEIEANLKTTTRATQAHIKEPLIDISTLPEFKTIHKISASLNELTAEDLLKILPFGPAFDHTYAHKICRFCFYNKINFNMFYGWYSQKQNTPEKYKKWSYHWANINKFPPYDVINIEKIILFYYPYLNANNKNILFEQQFKKIDNYDDQICIIKKLTPTILNEYNEIKKNDIQINNSLKSFTTYTEEPIITRPPPPKFTIFHIGMGGGKTETVTQYLKDKENYLWISPNMALAENTHSRINKANKTNKKCFHYINDKTHDNTLYQQEKLIICLNSIIKLKKINKISLISDNDDELIMTKKYNIVICDEIEAILLKFINNDTIYNVEETFKVFIDIIEKADHVVFMDAFISNLTYNFINALRGNKTKKIYKRPAETSDRKIKVLNTFDTWTTKIINDLTEKKRIFIYYPYKTKSSTHQSMINFKHYLEKSAGVKGQLYTADSGDDDLKKLNNVNEEWTKYDFIITNNKINVGVNYDRNDDYKFDNIYLCVAGFSSARDLIQVSYRCRNITNNIINIVYMGGTIDKSYIKPLSIPECAPYNEILKSSNIENSADNDISLILFSRMAGYSYQDDKIEEEEQTIKHKILNDDISAKYENIKSISTEEEIDEYKFKILKRQATFNDKMIINKYYFDNLFNEDTDETNKGRIWDLNHSSIIKSIKKIKHYDIFDQIKIINNWAYIVPSQNEYKNIHNIIMTDEIRTSIIKIFNLLHIKADKLNNYNLYIKFINTYFKKQLLQRKQINKRTSYIIDNDIYDSIIFYIENSKTNKILLSILDDPKNLDIYNYDDNDDFIDDK